MPRILGLAAGYLVAVFLVSLAIKNRKAKLWFRWVFFGLFVLLAAAFFYVTMSLQYLR